MNPATTYMAIFHVFRLAFMPNVSPMRREDWASEVVKLEKRLSYIVHAHMSHRLRIGKDSGTSQLYPASCSAPPRRHVCPSLSIAFQEVSGNSQPKTMSKDTPRRVLIFE
jgi:hypothetical protein